LAKASRKKLKFLLTNCLQRLFPMRKEYGKVKGFRIDKETEKLLNECFEMLSIQHGSFNAKMPRLINEIHKGLEELQDLRKKVQDQENQIRELNKKIPLEVKEIEKPQPPKSEAITPTQATQKPQVATSTREQVKFSPDGLSVLCKGPYYNQWIGSTICAICQDQECEIKKKTVAFPKRKMNLHLKQW
jgi:hypothetical protein